jgi:AraC-like DNA-binding protein
MSAPDKPASPAWISARHLQHMVRQAVAAGVPADMLLAAAGLPRQPITDADGMIPMAAIESVLAAMDRHPGSAMAGLQLAQEVQPATFGALGLLLQSCTTLADMLNILVRFNGLLSNVGTTTLAFGPGNTTLYWDCVAGSPSFRRHASEYVLGTFVVMARLMLPDHPHLPLAVRFAHAQPPGTSAGRDYFSFFRCPVHFGQDRNAVVIPSALLNIPLAHGDAALKPLLEQHALALLHRRQHPSTLEEDVRRLISLMIIKTIPDRDAVAAQLGISPRSLHRHLQEAGTGFREILDEVRLQMARQHLQDTANSISTIADTLGFSTHQAFLRWFKQHTGTTPGRFRQQESSPHVS